jgi:hypothetical protein
VRFCEGGGRKDVVAVASGGAAEREGGDREDEVCVYVDGEAEDVDEGDWAAKGPAVAE